MITGDAELTATKIASLAGIREVGSGLGVISGREIEKLYSMGEDCLANAIDNVAVCYRTSPR